MRGRRIRETAPSRRFLPAFPVETPLTNSTQRSRFKLAPIESFRKKRPQGSVAGAANLLAGCFRPGLGGDRPEVRIRRLAASPVPIIATYSRRYYWQLDQAKALRCPRPR